MLQTNKKKKQATKLFERRKKKFLFLACGDNFYFILFYKAEHIQQTKKWSGRFEDIAKREKSWYDEIF